MARDVNDIVVLGFGSWSDVNALPTLGFGIFTPQAAVGGIIDYIAPSNRLDYVAPASRLDYIAPDVNQ